MNKTILNIGGMSCSACSIGLEKFLKKQKGILNVSVNLVFAQALIEYDDSLTIKDLENLIKKAGFESLGEPLVNKTDKTKMIKKLVIMILLILILMYIIMSPMLNLPIIDYLKSSEHPKIYATTLLLLTIPFLIYGFGIIKNGIKNLFRKTPNMDTLVCLGVLTSFIYSFINTILILTNQANIDNLYYESSAMIVFFITLGRYIDVFNKNKTKEAIMNLVQITPKTATIKTANGPQEITIDEVTKGDILLCKAGSIVAVDGIITTGTAHLDESFITGESKPVIKKANDKVIAGSLNYDGYFEYKAEHIGKDSTISGIVKLVVTAINTKPPITKIADKVCSYFVPVIMIIALITLIGYLLLGFEISTSVIHFVNVLVVACPCALGLATPLAIVISEGKCAQQGILVKTSSILENASKIDTIVFDKTGTLTYGDLKISEIINYSHYNKKELITLIASLEENSNHPIAKAFTKHFKNYQSFTVIDFKEEAGIGLSGIVDNKKTYVGNSKIFSKLKIKNNYENIANSLTKKGNSIVYVIQDKKLLAIIGIKDIIRKNATETVKNLSKNIVMLSGDDEHTAQIIANEVGIKKVIANVLPKDKVKVINDMLQNNQKVMMVGDGVNDAPSLVTSTIGVSMKTGSEIANNTADVILLNDDLSKIKELMDISKKTLKIIKQNLFWAFAYNIIMIPIAIGLFIPLNIDLNPMLASLAMMISSLTVVLNSLRLK